MNGTTRKTALSPPRRRLVEMMQSINFGQILELVVRGGEPVLDPPPEIVREVKLGANKHAQASNAAGDFVLKAQVVELFEHLDLLGTGSIEVLEVQNGLPFRLRLRGKVVSHESR
jgi:hypothetical protein